MTAERVVLPARSLVTQPNDEASAKVFPSASPAPFVTVREYLNRERASETRHEYVDGVILAMAGETLNHNRIASNVSRYLNNRFEDTPCEAFIENIRLRVTPTRYRYPDVIALCGTPELDDEKPPCLLNPAVLVEVSSPSTEEEDRREKFMEYRELPSLTDYILIAQHKIHVTHYARQTELLWPVTIYTRLEDVVTLNALNVSLTLSEIYRKIVFDAPDASSTPDAFDAPQAS